MDVAKKMGSKCRTACFLSVRYKNLKFADSGYNASLEIGFEKAFMALFLSPVKISTKASEYKF